VRTRRRTTTADDDAITFVAFATTTFWTRVDARDASRGDPEDSALLAKTVGTRENVAR